MEIQKSHSIFHTISSRELHGGLTARKRPYCADTTPDFAESGSISIEHDGDESPPLAVSFCKTYSCSHILAVADENGCVSLFNSRKKFTSSLSSREYAEKARIGDWTAHQNAIFDLCWIKDDSSILTASGDQTIKLWNVERRKSIAVFIGHHGSVKSLCPHPANPDLIISGSRDGSFAIWDLRCNNNHKTKHGDCCINPACMVEGAHLPLQRRRVKRIKSNSQSVTSVLYLKDEISIATAGAVDSIIKFWDTRNLKSQVTQACPDSTTTEKEGRLHGVSSLSQDSNGVLLSASCTDNSIYLYNVLRLEKGPQAVFSGCQIESFYVKAAISPDAAHIASGSSDGCAYVWQVNKPDIAPTTLDSYDGEVTAVAWCPSEDGKLATASDDFTVRLWNIESTFCSSKTPTTLRRRVMAIPAPECKRLSAVREVASLGEDSNILQSPARELPETNSISSSTSPKVGTPASQKKTFITSTDFEVCCEKTPEATLKSPSSVLNPPSSVKRTIRDYFLAVS